MIYIWYHFLYYFSINKLKYISISTFIMCSIFMFVIIFIIFTFIIIYICYWKIFLSKSRNIASFIIIVDSFFACFLSNPFVTNLAISRFLFSWSWEKPFPLYFSCSPVSWYTYNLSFYFSRFYTIFISFISLLFFLVPFSFFVNNVPM